MRLSLLRHALGFVLGALLIACVATSAVDLLELPFGPPEERYAVRALGWLVAALVLLVAGPAVASRRSVELLRGAALGVLVHAFFGPRELPLAVAAGLSLALALAVREGARRLSRIGSTSPGRLTSPGSPGSEDPWPRWCAASLPTSLLGGLGAALVFEGIARPLRLLGAGHAPDDSVFAATLALLVAVGAASVGRLADAFGRERARGIGTVAVFVGLTGALGYLGLGFVGGVASPGGLREYLARVHTDTSMRGTWGYDLVLAGPAFLLPAFALGAALRPARRRELLAMLLGAAAATWLVPALLAREGASSAGLARVGALACGLSAGWAFLIGKRSRSARLSGLGLALAVCALAALVPTGPLYVVQPWSRAPRRPDWAGETPAGQWTLTGQRTDFPEVALDGVALTPGLERAAGDAECLRLSVALVPEERRAGMSVLVVGPLTPGRALALKVAGAARIDRVTAGAPRELEARVLAAATVPLPDAGELLDVARARENLAAGEYDLVLVPPVPGRAPPVTGVRPPLDTIVVLWLDAGAALASRPFARPVLLALHELEDLAAGLAWGGAPPATPRPDEVCALPAGEPLEAEPTLAWLVVRERDRPRLARARFAERLARATRGSEWAQLASGLARLYAAQRPSSPFESPAERVELDAAALDELRAAALARRPDELTRAVWNALARVLSGKRDVERIDACLAPLARAHPPWKELEMALARADLEALEPARAVERLRALVAAEPGDLELAGLFAEAQAQAGDAAGAAETRRRIEALRGDE